MNRQVYGRRGQASSARERPLTRRKCTSTRGYPRLPGSQAILSLRRPRRRHDIQKLLVASTSKRTGSAQSGFESRDAVRVETRFRAKSLNGFSYLLKEQSQLQKARAAARLAKMLRRVRNADRLHSFSNPYFFRKVRRRFLSEILRLVSLAPIAEARIYHIASSKYRFPGSQLTQFQPRQFIQSLRANLNFVSDLKGHSGWFIVFVHNDHDSRTDTFSPHFHVLVVGEKYKAFEALRSLKLFKGGRGSSTYFPVVVQPLEDPARQISYLWKAYWPGKPTRTNEKGKIVTGRSRRMAEPRHAESILFLHELGFSDLVWMHGVEIHGRRLNLTIPGPVKMLAEPTGGVPP